MFKSFRTITEAVGNFVKRILNSASQLLEHLQNPIFKAFGSYLLLF